jgi:hypothetical protein
MTNKTIKHVFSRTDNMSIVYHRSRINPRFVEISAQYLEEAGVRWIFLPLFRSFNFFAYNKITASPEDACTTYVRNVKWGWGQDIMLSPRVIFLYWWVTTRITPSTPLTSWLTSSPRRSQVLNRSYVSRLMYANNWNQMWLLVHVQTVGFRPNCSTDHYSNCWLWNERVTRIILSEHFCIP